MTPPHRTPTPRHAEACRAWTTTLRDLLLGQLIADVEVLDAISLPDGTFGIDTVRLTLGNGRSVELFADAIYDGFFIALQGALAPDVDSTARPITPSTDLARRT